MARAQVPINLSPSEADVVSQKLVNGQVCEAKLANTQAAYSSCVNDRNPETQFWQKPGFIIAGISVQIGLTLIVVCATHAMGACR